MLVRSGMTVNVRSDLSVPLGTQLFWQLRYAIATGEYEPGERLATVREMAAALRVNANTIRAVYARLQDEGWVVARRKVGTVVADPLPRTYDDALEAILDHAFDEAASQGIEADEFAAGAFARAAQRAAVGARRLLFVECGRDETEPFVSQLRAAFGDRVERVEGALILELEDRLAEGEFDAVVTTAHHAEEVRALVSQVPVVSLLPSPEFMDAVAEIAALPPGTRVGVPYPCQTPRRNAVAMIRRIAPRVEVVEAETGDDPALATCDIVVAWSKTAADGMAPGTRVLSWNYGVDAAALVHLRRQLGL
jgi:DNA-binding transcriptional regulator YhcF (GntR family)